MDNSSQSALLEGHRYSMVSRNYSAIDDDASLILVRQISSRSGILPNYRAGGVPPDLKTVKEEETSLKSEVSYIVQSCVPLIVTFVLQYSLTVASVYAVGNLGPDELGAVSLSNLLASISSYGIIQGIASSLSTLCPQAYGREDYRAVGLQCMRCACLLFLMYIPIFVLWFWLSFPILRYLVPEENAARLASEFLRRLIWGVPGFIVFEVTKQYLQAQGIFKAGTYVLAVCAPLNVVMNLAFVHSKTFGMGFIGAPTAVVCTNWLMAILLVLYATFINGYQCWCGFSNLIFTHWGPLLSLAGPGVLMIEAEWLAFEIISVASSRFGTTALAAQSIIATTCVSIYQVPYSVAVAASTRVAWFIGANSPTASRMAARAALILAVCIGTLDCLLLLIGRFRVASWFSQDDAVIELAGKSLIVAAAYQVVDAFSCVSGGILRGQGRQYIGGWLNLVCYYVVALPVSWACGFKFHWGLIGLWVGILVALTTISIGSGIAIYVSDWNQIVDRCLADFVDDYSVQIEVNDDDDVISFISRRSTLTAMVDHNMLAPSLSHDNREFIVRKN